MTPRLDQLTPESQKCPHGLYFGTTCDKCEVERLEKERAEWQETAEAYCQNAGRWHDLLGRIHAACGRAISGDHDKKSMLATLQLCAGLAASRQSGGKS